MAKVAKAPKVKTKRRTWTLRLPDYWPASPNVRMHWRTRHQQVAKAASIVMAYGHPLPTFVGKVKLTIIREWGYKQRALDPDNLVASTKVLIDVLRSAKKINELNNRLGVITDDRPESFIGGAPIVKQRRAKGTTPEKSTIIVIEGRAICG